MKKRTAMHVPVAGLSRASVIAAGMVLMVSTAHASPPKPAPLTGDWGGPQVRLHLGEAGGRLDMSCASASIDTPVRPDAAGRFGATGRYESFTGGPTRADAPPSMVVAHFDGHVEGNSLHLSVRQHGVKTAENFTLERGRRVKLIRCM